MAANKFLLQQDLGQPIEGQVGSSMFENIATANETLQNATRRVYRKMTTDKVVDITPDDGQEITAPVIEVKKYEDYVRSDEAQAMFRVFKRYVGFKTLKNLKSFISCGKDAKLFKESDNVKAFQEAVLESRTENR